MTPLTHQRRARVAHALLSASLFATAGISVAQSQSQPGVEYSGQVNVRSTESRIAGAPSEESAQLLATSRTGTDFHIVATGFPTDSLVEIELGFAELAATGAGQRVFDLDINDKRALSNFDIYETAGGPNRAVIRRFTITPRRALLDFHFTATVGEASIGYIKVRGRGFTKTLTTAGTASNAGAPTVSDPDALPTNLPTYDKETGAVMQDQLSPTWPNGFPLGGIGTGKFEILPNGQFANFTINNSWDLPVATVPGTFFAVGTKSSSGNGVGKILRINAAGSSSGYLNAKSFLSCTFTALFPIAQWVFKDDKIPLDVTVEGWSPIIPQNVQDSSLPAAVLYVHLRNPRSFPISAGIAFSWEDVNGRGGSRNRGDQFGYAGQAVFSDAATSSIQGVLIRSMAPADGRRGSFMGDYFIGTPVKRAVVTRQLYWDPRGSEIPWWRSFTNRMRLEKVGPVPASVSPQSQMRGAARGPGAAVICTTVNLAPKERRRIPFIVAWYAPKLTTVAAGNTPGTTEQQDYATTFGSSLGVASYIASNRPKLQSGTTEWQSMVLRSNLPFWMKSHALNSLSTIVSNSILLQGRRFSMLESPGEMGGMMGALDHRLAMQPFLTEMYPDLDRTELELYGTAQTADGHLPRYIGNIHGGWTGLDPKLLGQTWSDPTAAWVVQSAGHYRQTGDNDFFSKIRPALDRAIGYLEKHETDGGSFFDESSPAGSDVAYSAVNRAAAFRALADVFTSGTETTGPANLAATADAMSASAAAMLTQYGNSQTSATFAAALAGDWALRDGGLRSVVADEAVTAALAAIESRHLKAYNPAAPVEVNGDGSLSKGLPTYPLLLQPFLGAAAIRAGAVDLGIELYQRAHELAFGVQFNPWRQALSCTVPEGAHPRLQSHMSSPAGWTILSALSGAALDVPNRTLYLDPQVPSSLQDGEMTIPVFTPAFWAWLDFNAQESTGTLAVTKVFPGYENLTIDRIGRHIGADGKIVQEQKLEPALQIKEGELIRFEGWPRKSQGKVLVGIPELSTADNQTTQSMSPEDDESSSPATLTNDGSTTDTTTSGTAYGP